ncbi:DoxX family protein [Nocardia sp. NPDC024068]|uniref:DoxX family protein n=1 Tax=Nocardia sp. NPDC024068 TaxID=3157197 RepID=UPI0033F301FD
MDAQVSGEAGFAGSAGVSGTVTVPETTGERGGHEPGDTPGAGPVRWPWPLRVAFRFAVIYCALFCALIGQILFAFAGVVYDLLPDQAPIWPLLRLSPLLEWVGRTVFGAETVFRQDSGSGDQAAIWVLMFCLLVVSAVVTALWSVLDRRRPAYPRLSAWFLTALRWCLAGQMLFYGIAKAIPTQMPPPPLSALLQPFGEMTPMSVLWLQVGSSPVYEILLGTAELLGGLLLLIPRTATLGALLSLVSMAQVFVLNMTFDVPVKILSFHLLVFSLILLAPQLRRFLDFFVLARRADPVLQPPLFAGRRANRYAAVAQALLGVWLVAGIVQIGWSSWDEFGGGVPKPPLYGLWEVTEFRVGGQPVEPLLTDGTRWRRVVVEVPGAVTLQSMDGRLVTVPATVDTTARTFAVTMPAAAPEEPPVVFAYDGPEGGRLRFDGELDGRAAVIEMRAVDPGEFRLNGPRFHWVQDYPAIS